MGSSRILCPLLLQQVALILLAICETSQQLSEEMVQGPPHTPEMPDAPAHSSQGYFKVPGHMQPLGSHRPPENPGVEELDYIPDPYEFFDRYLRDGKPVVFRGAAKNMAAYQLWTDEYLSEKYGHLEVAVEEGKKENRSQGVWDMKLSDFVTNYKKDDMYLVADVHKEMSDEFGLLRCLSCGFSDLFTTAVMWFSSGGTKSVLHFDSVDNINCVMDGSKELFFVDKKEKAHVDIDNVEGAYSNVDVEKVNVTKYPGLGHVPWYNVTLEKSDCLFIPYKWFHSVKSTGRNLAVNIWFNHRVLFDDSDCPSDLSTLPEFLPLSSVITSGMEDAAETVRAAIAEQAYSNGGSLTLRQLQEVTDLKELGLEDVIEEIFELLNENRDDALDLHEIYSDKFMEAFKQFLETVQMEDGEYEEMGVDEEEGWEEDEGRRNAEHEEL